MSKEKQTDVNDNIIKEAKMDKDKNKSPFLPLIEKEQNDSRINNIFNNLQNSANKNLKSDRKSDPNNNM